MSRRAVLAGPPAPLDLLQQRRFDRRHRRAEAALAGQPARPQRRRHAQPPGLVERRGQPLQQRPQLAQALRFVGAEDRAHDHLLGDRLHLRPELERLARRPGAHDLARRLGHHRRVGLHPLPVERRQHHPAALHVRRLLQQHHRARSQNRQQQRVGERDAEAARGRGEDAFHVGGVAEEDPRAGVQDAQREDVAVALLAALHQRVGTRRPAERLQRPRHPRPGRQRHRRSLPSAAISSSSSLQVAAISSSNRSPLKSSGSFASAPRAR